MLIYDGYLQGIPRVLCTGLTKVFCALYLTVRRLTTLHILRERLYLAVGRSAAGV